MAGGVFVEDYRDGDEAAVLRIAGAALGEGYVDDLGPVLARPGAAVLVARGAPAGPALGFVWGWRLAPGALAAEHPELGPSPLPPALARADAAGRLALLKTIAVDPACRGRGIGPVLVQAFERRLRALGAATFLSPAWVHDDGVPVDRLLSGFGYRPWHRVPRLWRRGCEDGEFACPARRPGEGCCCDAVYYARAA